MLGFFSIPESALTDAFTGAGNSLATSGFFWLFTLIIGLGVLFYVLGSASGKGAEDPYEDEWQGDHEFERDTAIDFEKDDV